MPFTQQQDEPLDHRINIRLTATEKAQLEAQAEAAGLTLSRYGRRRLLGRRVLAQADETVLRELRRLGGLLKHVHNLSEGAYSRDTVEVLQSLRCAIERIARDR